MFWISKLTSLIAISVVTVAVLSLYPTKVQASHANNGYQSDITLEAWTGMDSSSLQLKVHGPGPSDGQEGELSVWPAVGVGDAEPAVYSVLGMGITNTSNWFVDPAMTVYASFNWSPSAGNGPYWFRSVARDQNHHSVEEANYSPGGCSPQNVTLSWFNTIDTLAHTCGLKWTPAPPPGSSGNQSCPANDSSFPGSYMTACAYSGTGETNYLGTWNEQNPNSNGIWAQPLKAPPDPGQCCSNQAGWDSAGNGPFGRNDDFTVVWRGQFFFQGSSTGGYANYYMQIANDDDYYLYFDDMNTPFASGGCCNTGPNYYKSLANGWHNVKFVAHESVGSATFSLFWQRDDTPPSISTISAQGLSNSQGGPVGAKGSTFRFTVTASDIFPTSINTTYGSARIFISTYPFSTWNRVFNAPLSWNGSQFYYDVQLDDVYNTQYRVLVQISDINGNLATRDENPMAFSIANTPPPSATYSSLCNGCVTAQTSSVTLSVNPVTDVDGQQVYYYFRVSASTNPDTNTICSGAQQTATSYTCNYAFAQGVTYYWHAHTYDGVNTTLATSVWSFAISSPPSVLSITGGPTGSWAGKQTYTITGQYRDVNGNQDLDWHMALLNYGIDGNGSALYLAYRNSVCSIYGGNGDSAGGPGYIGNGAWNASPYTALPWVDLTGCSFSTPNGTDRTINWTVSIKSWNETNVNYYGFAWDLSSTYSGWQGPYKTIGIDSTAPTQNNLNVSSLNGWWQPNGTNTYNITLSATDNLSLVNESATMRAIVNSQGSNAANPRGYFVWSGTSYVLDGDQQTCSGGGYGSKSRSGWKGSLITLVSCSTSTSGNQRTVVFTVRPELGFGEFGQINDVSMDVTDLAANDSGWTNWDTNFGTDATIPSNSLISPACNSSLKGTITLSTTASDGLSGMSRVEFWRDGSTLMYTDNVSGDGWSYGWNSTSPVVSDGTHTLTFKAYDTAGNNNPVNCSVTLDNGLPTIAITNMTGTTNYTITNAGTTWYGEGAAGSGWVTTGTATDVTSGINRIERSVTGFNWSSGTSNATIPTAGASYPTSWTKNVTDSQDNPASDGVNNIGGGVVGVNTFTLSSVDNVSNYSNSVYAVFKVDRSAPLDPVITTQAGCGQITWSFPWVQDRGLASSGLTSYTASTSGNNYIAGVGSYRVKVYQKNNSSPIYNQIVVPNYGQTGYTLNLTGLSSTDNLKFTVRVDDNYGNQTAILPSDYDVNQDYITPTIAQAPSQPTALSPNSSTTWTNLAQFSWTSVNNNPASCPAALNHQVTATKGGVTSNFSSTSSPVTGTLTSDGVYSWQAQDTEGYSNLSSALSEVATMQYDATPPTLVNSYVSDHPNNALNFSINAADNLSGLQQGTFEAYYGDPNTGKFTAVTTAITPTTYGGSTATIFSFTIPDKVSGRYVEYICTRVKDQAGNTSSGYSNCYEGAPINVSTPCNPPQVCIDTSWLQVLGSPLHTNYNTDVLSAPSSATQPYNYDKKLSTNGINRNLSGSSSSVTMENYSSSGSLNSTTGRNTVPYPSYSDLFTRLYSTPDRTVTQTSIFAQPTLDQAFLASIATKDNVYYTTGNLSISSDITTTGTGTTRRSVVFFVDGKLTISGNISISIGGDNTLIFVTKGGIDIGKDVASLDGVYVSEGIINTAYDNSGGVTPQLIVNGSLVSIPLNGGDPATDYLLLKRNLGASANTTNPAEKIVFNPKYYLWAQKTFGSSKYSYSEVTP